MMMADNDTSWIAADWPAPAHVRAGTSLRSGGVSAGSYSSLNLAAHVGDDIERVKTNRDRFIQQLSLPAAPVWLEQVHGNHIVSLDDENPACLSADGSCTVNRNKVCSILTADCVPLLMCDGQGTQIAAIHAGWRGICSGIIDRAVALYPDPKKLLVWIGPCIGKDYYEVGNDVLEASICHAPNSATAFEQTDASHWLCDLVSLVEINLANRKVKNCFKSGLCTYANKELFYSYRRDGKTGRTASMIWME